MAVILVRESRVIAALRDIPFRVRIVTSVSLFLASFIFWIFFLYLPQRSLIQKFDYSLQALKNNNVEFVNDVIGDEYYDELSYKQYLDLTLKTIYGNNLSCGKFETTGNFIDLSLIGTYENFISFFQNLNLSNAHISVNMLNASSTNGEKIEMSVRLEILCQ